MILHFSHANGFPAACYRKMFSYLERDFEIDYVNTIGHDPRHPVDALERPSKAGGDAGVVGEQSSRGRERDTERADGRHRQAFAPGLHVGDPGTAVRRFRPAS